jgi:4-oxalocrotonate tautomerase family enzyme
MPVILFYGPVANMDKEKKKELVKLFTDASVKVTGIPATEFTVLLRATSPDCVGIGGDLLCDKAPHK